VVEVAGERTLDAAPGFAVGLAGAKQSLVVGSRLTIVADAGERDHVQGAIQLPVAAAVEAMTPLAPARGIDRAGAGERRKGGLAPHAGGIAAGGDQLRRADGTNSALGQQLGNELADDRLELGFQLRQLGLELLHPSSEPTQDTDEHALLVAAGANA